MSKFLAMALLIAGPGLLLAGLVFGVYPNPWGFDGHSRLTCGNALGGDGYSAYHPDCRERRTRMRLYALTLMAAGAASTAGGAALVRRR